VFAGAPEVDTWEAVSSGSYRLTVSDPDAAAPELARALVHAGADICSLTESRHSLEDVYLELVDEDVEAKRR
jgi:ABC-2 type transport system ATP-binding protein